MSQIGLKVSPGQPGQVHLEIAVQYMPPLLINLCPNTVASCQKSSSFFKCLGSDITERTCLLNVERTHERRSRQVP